MRPFHREKTIYTHMGACKRYTPILLWVLVRDAPTGSFRAKHNNLASGILQAQHIILENPPSNTNLANPPKA